MISQLETKIFEGLKDLPRISELDFVPIDTYSIRTEELVLHPLIDDHDALVIPGAFFGDEGKGKTVHAVAHHPEIQIVARVNSGENAGHTVYHIIDPITRKKFIFHLMPSGILIPDKINAIGPECVMDPISFLEKEVKQLISNGIDYDHLFVGNVYIVTPYHKLEDFLSNPSNASTLKGMGPVHASKVMKRGIRLDDLFNSQDVQRKKLEKDMERYQAMLQFKNWSEEAILERCAKMNTKDNQRIPDHIINFLKADDKIEYLLDLYETHVTNNSQFPQRADVRKMIRDSLRAGWKVLLEASQSYWLDNSTEKHAGSSTSAHTSANGVIASAGYDPRAHRTVVFNIHKLPPSRVGLGANPIGLVPQTYFSDQGIDSLEKLAGRCENVADIEKLYFDSVQDNGILKPTIYHDPNSGGQYLVGQALAIAWSRKFEECGATTKKPRVLGLFDCVAHYEVNEIQGPYLSISAVDHFDDCEKVGIVLAYVYHHPEGQETDSNGRMYKNGDIIKSDDVIPCEQVLYHCHPIVKVMDGWNGSPIAADKRARDDPLPKNLQKMIGAIEHFTGSDIISIGNGKNSEDLIYLKRD